MLCNNVRVMKMKKYDVVLSLYKYKRKLNQMVLKRKLTDKRVVRLSQKIDKLHNMYEQF